MPYIKQEKRDRFDESLNTIESISEIGDLNYLFSALAKKYVHQHGTRYEHLNAVVGAFESAKAEFQRQVVNPYEDIKIAESGSLY